MQKPFLFELNPTKPKEAAMKQALLRSVPFFACKFLLSSTKCNAFSSIPKRPLFAALTRSQLRFYSSGSKEDDDVSNEELKMRIQRYFDGDEEAIPSIFEGILKRKLSGKHEESDDELMKEIRHLRHESPPKDQEFDSDLTDED
ncbi:hypothetical protein QUC31_007195 [Theobroma cacao]